MDRFYCTPALILIYREIIILDYLQWLKPDSDLVKIPDECTTYMPEMLRMHEYKMHSADSHCYGGTILWICIISLLRTVCSWQSQQKEYDEDSDETDSAFIKLVVSQLGELGWRESHLTRVVKSIKDAEK